MGLKWNPCDAIDENLRRARGQAREPHGPVVQPHGLHHGPAPLRAGRRQQIFVLFGGGGRGRGGGGGGYCVIYCKGRLFLLGLVSLPDLFLACFFLIDFVPQIAVGRDVGCADVELD